ncbi:hypothetical protein C473_08912 [Halorubrum distributum JCM 10247]|uniref:Uncharacterized protein n=1 Tax=Halorubrum distributum JCM 10247 TaxID=1227486 RepID=M0D9H7_9EURY|nr:hypothetical protein C473_08912 [Halorubrum terrestre JCM 10247]
MFSQLTRSEVVGREGPAGSDRGEQRFRFARIQSIPNLGGICVGRGRSNGQIVPESVDRGIEVLVALLQSAFRFIPNGKNHERRR